MDTEIENMHRLSVFKEDPRPSDRNHHWVFRRKFENGTSIKHKARLLARVITQVSGINYHEACLFALVVRLETLRVLISIAALFNHDHRQFAAYLHGEIGGEIYMGPRSGMEQEDIIWLLLKGLYGLKQAGRIRHERFNLQSQRDHVMLRIGD